MLSNSQNLNPAVKASRDRLHPSVRDPNYLVLSKRREIFKKWLEEFSGDRLRVLDVGGRLQPYRPLLQGRIAVYVAVDVLWTPLVDVLARGEALPFSANYFDVVICTQVLQWIAEPQIVLDEIYRVLKPGGHLLLSVSAAEPLTSAQDYWRFTPASINRILRRFSNVVIQPEGNTVAGFFRTVAVYLSLVAKYRLLRSAMAWLVFPLLNIAGLGLEKLSRSDNCLFSVNYSVLAKKEVPEGNSGA